MFPFLDFGFETEKKGTTPKLFSQVHEDTVIEIPDKATWTALRENPVPADGAFTFQTNLPIYAFSADCMTLLFFTENPEGPIGAVHCGWRGVRRGIVTRFLQKARGSNLHVILGPCILPCCFEVKDDFVSVFKETKLPVEPYLETREGKLFCDLPRFVIETQLPGVQTHLENLRCTYCSRPPLPSFRRQKETDPNIRAWIKKR